MSDTAASLTGLQTRIESLWEGRETINVNDTEVVATVHEAIDALDTGLARVAQWNDDGSVTVNQWCKYAVLLLFKVSQMETIEHGPFEYADKIPLKTGYMNRGVRVVPGAQARWGSYQAPGVVMMPSYTNIGAYVGENTMVDTWATVGSCAQIGKNVHLSGGVGIGGVLEPAQAAPVMIGDECMIGSRCIVAEGARVGEGTVLGAGAILTGSIPVIDVETGEEISRGEVPSWCVAVAGTRPRTFPGGEFGLPCILVLKRLAAGERHDKSALNDILRDHGQAV
jgi:2,3,4,5-tetrahydropyridine-2-carboxylate N-succinyltransferase